MSFQPFFGFPSAPVVLPFVPIQVGQRMKDSMEEAKTSSNSAKQKALLHFAKDGWSGTMGIQLIQPAEHVSCQYILRHIYIIYI